MVAKSYLTPIQDLKSRPESLLCIYVDYFKYTLSDHHHYHCYYHHYLHHHCSHDHYYSYDCYFSKPNEIIFRETWRTLFLVSFCPNMNLPQELDCTSF